MLRHNVFACARDTSEGVRRPRFPTNAARSGPYPPLEPAGPADDDEPPRRPSSREIGTVNTPVFVLSERLQEVGSRASAWGGIPTPTRQSSRLDDGDRAATVSFNDMSAAEGSASGKGVIQQGADSSGRDGDLACTSVAATGFGSADGDAAGSYDGGISAVEGGSSGRRIIEQGVDSSAHDTDLPGAPLGAAGFGLADDDQDIARRTSEKSLSTLGSSATGSVGSIQAGASGRGLMVGDGLGYNYCSRSAAAPYRNDFVLAKLASAQKSVPRSQGDASLSNSDLASSESGPTRRRAGSRNSIRHGESNEYEQDNLPPMQEERELGAEDVSGAARGGGGAGSSGRFTFDLLKSRRPVESDVPKRKDVAAVGAAAAAAAAGSFSSKALWDSASHAGDGHIHDDGVDRIRSGRHTTGLPSIPWGGARGPTEAGVPRRRSVDGSGRTDLTAESEAPGGADSDSHPAHLPDGSKGEPRLAASARLRFPLGFGNNPTESSLPRRRPSHAPAWGDTSGEGLDDSPGASARNEQCEDFSSPDDGGSSDVGADRGRELVGPNVSAGRGDSRRGAVAGWGVKNRGPVAIDLPRRRSGYSIDASVRSMENVSVAGDSLLHVVADDLRAEGGVPAGEENRARNGSGKQGSSVLAGLAGRSRGPVESSLPRRRRSPEIPLPGGDMLRPTEDVSSRGVDGISSTSANEDEGVSDSAASVSRGLSGGVSATGGWRSGLKSRAPVAIDLPRRSSGYSADVWACSVDRLDVAGKPLRLQKKENAEDGDKQDTKGNTDVTVGTARRGSGSAPSVMADRKSSFPTLAGHKRAPVESDLPRRRPSKYLTTGGASAAGNVYGAEVRASDSQSDENEAVCELAGSASREWSSGVSTRGGWRSGLNSRAPVAIDLPRRTSGYPVDGSARSEGGPLLLVQQGEHAEDGDTGNSKNEADGGVDSVRKGSGEVPRSASVGRNRLFPTLAGHKRAPVESNLPRRRPSTYLKAGGDSAACDVGEAEVGASDAQSIDENRSGKGGSGWGLRGKAPIACDLPRRSSVHLSASSHAAAVVAYEDTGLDVGDEDSVLGGGGKVVGAGQGLGMRVQSFDGEGNGLRSSNIGPFVERDGDDVHTRSRICDTDTAHPAGVGSQAFVIDGGFVSVRQGHGLGVSIGSSIGRDDVDDGDDSRSSGDQHGEAKVSL